MGDLDKWFGPKPKGEKNLSPRFSDMSQDEIIAHLASRGEQQKNWRCEEHLKALCAEFDRLWPECTPSPGNRSSWYVGLRKIYREFGEQGGAAFIRFAKDEIEDRDKERVKTHKRPLDIVDAHSIFFLVKDFKRLVAGQGNRCPECGETDPGFCIHEWGNRRRNEMYEDA